jgi:hypothetical protein
MLNVTQVESAKGIANTEFLRYHGANDPAFPDVDRQRHGCEGASALDARRGLGTLVLRNGLHSGRYRSAAKHPQLMASHERAANFYAFSRMGHSLFALLASLIGGTAASWLYTRRKRAEAAARQTRA